MVSETFLGIYYWGVYVWFCIGVALVAFPAIYEIVKLMKALKKQEGSDG